MPVQSGDLHHLVITTRAGIKTGLDAQAGDDQVNDTGRDVQSVKAGNHEERRAELRRTHRVAPRANAFVDDKLGPFEGLHADECGAENRGRHHQPERLVLVSAIAHVDSHRHRATRRNQDEGHDGDQDQRNRLSAE